MLRDVDNVTMRLRYCIRYRIQWRGEVRITGSLFPCVCMRKAHLLYRSRGLEPFTRWQHEPHISSRNRIGMHPFRLFVRPAL